MKMPQRAGILGFAYLGFCLLVSGYFAWVAYASGNPDTIGVFLIAAAIFSPFFLSGITGACLAILRRFWKAALVCSALALPFSLAVGFFFGLLISVNAFSRLSSTLSAAGGLLPLSAGFVPAPIRDNHIGLWFFIVTGLLCLPEIASIVMIALSKKHFRGQAST